jgi:hypothetical protein
MIITYDSEGGVLYVRSKGRINRSEPLKDDDFVILDFDGVVMLLD